MRMSADIRVVLNDGLQQQHGSDVEKRIEFDGVLGLERRRAGGRELLAEMILHIPERHRVVYGKRERLVEANSRGKDGIVAVDVARAPIVCESTVEAFGAFGIHTPESLARHPIKQVVSRLPFSGSGGELSGIV